MSDLLREQLSAFMDGELPSEECALLLKRVGTSAELAGCWRAWHLIGDSLRGEVNGAGAEDIAGRVNRALDEAETKPDLATPRHSRRWAVRRSATVAAGVAVIGLAGLVGALVSRQIGGSQVLVPAATGSAAARGSVQGSMQQVDWRKAPQPVRAELNRYLLMHEVYGVNPMAPADNAARGTVTASRAVSATGTDGP